MQIPDLYEPTFSQKAKSFFYRLIHLGYGCCFRCKMPWASVKSHSTNYTKTEGCFPLCEDCWESLTVKERLPYYYLLWMSWESKHRPNWNLIEEAVRDGK